MDHGILNSYCVAFGTYTSDEGSHLFFKLIGKLVSAFVGRWQVVDECRSQFRCSLLVITLQKNLVYNHNKRLLCTNDPVFVFPDL